MMSVTGSDDGSGPVDGSADDHVEGSDGHEDRTEESKGIPEWKDKLALLQEFTNTTATLRILIDALVGERDSSQLGGEQPDVVKKYLHTSVRKGWVTNAPSGERGQMFLTLAVELLMEKGASGDQEALRTALEKGTFDEFKRLVTGESDRIRDGHGFIIFGVRIPLPDIVKDVNTGMLDQRRLYLSYDAPEIWDKIARAYDQFNYCREALNQFLKSRVWKDFCQSEGFAGAVAFGAGSASKDVMICEALREVKGNSPLSYTLVDCSYYMLDHTFEVLEENSVQEQSRVELQLYHQDFTQMSKDDFPVSASPGPRAWFITGGTIGNVDESKFLASVARVCQAGDLLMISMDTIAAEGEARKQHCRELLERYNRPSIRNLLKLPLRAVWEHIGDDGSVADAVHRIDVKSSDPSQYSAVPNGSFSVYFTAGLESRLKREMVLAVSTRYVEGSFKEFAEERGFEYVETYSARQDRNFKILVFRYRG